MTLKRFSKDYRTYGKWLKAQPRTSEYARRIIRFHERFPTLSLNELRNTRLKDNNQSTASWNVLKAQEKRDQLAGAEITRYKAEGKADQIPTLIRALEEKDVSLLAAPTFINQTIAETKRKIDAEAPAQPRITEDRYLEGVFKQRGIVTSLEQDVAGFEARADAIRKMVATWERVIDLFEEGGISEGEALAIEKIRDALADANQEIGVLDEKARNLQTTLGEQLAVGLDPTNIANRLSKLGSSLSNLGTTIQNDIVQGIDGMGDAFAEALVEGESFTEGMKNAFVEMMKQIAKDAAKTGFMTLIQSLFGGISGGSGSTAKTTGGGTSSTSGLADLASSVFSGLRFAGGGVVKNVVSKVSNKYAGGGVITGPGTGTSDSIAGAIVSSTGQAIQGIRVSAGESIVTAKATRAVGPGFIHSINKMDSAGLSKLGAVIRGLGFAKGAVIPSDGFAQKATSFMQAGAPPLAFATGAVIGDVNQMVGGSSLSTTKASTHSYVANVNIAADGNSGVTDQELRRLDEGVTARIQDYVEGQMRPGGLLEAARRG